MFHVLSLSPSNHLFLSLLSSLFVFLPSSSIYPTTTAVPQCPSLLTLLASTPHSWAVQLVSWLYQEHSVLFLPILWEKMAVIKSPTCLDRTHTLQGRST